MSVEAEQYSWITGDLLRRTVLKNWDKLTRLGETVLAHKSRFLRHKIDIDGYSNTTNGRGIALRALIAELVEKMRPPGNSPDFTQKPWRMHFILEEQFLKQRAVDVLISELGVSKSTYFRDQIAACELLAEGLCQLEIDFIRQKTKQRIYPSNMPFPVPALVGRDSLVGKIVEGLLTSGIVTLAGIPGIGKTALAITVANRIEILSHFPDGILWAGVGKEHNILTILAEWAYALGIRGNQDLNTTEDWSNAIHKAIGLRRFLLVIDDVWRIEDALLFRVGGKNCAHLVTTRSLEVALRFSQEETIVVKELDDDSGMELLAQIAPQAVEMNQDACKDIVRTTSALPLALVLIGNYLRVRAYGKRLWSLTAAFEQLKLPDERMNLQEPPAPANLHPSLPANTWISLENIIQISHDVLDIEAQRALQALSVFPPKPNTFSEAAALAVSKTAPEVLDQLAIKHGLIEISGPDQYCLHQVIADFAHLKSKTDDPVHRLVKYYSLFCRTNQHNPIVLELEIQNILKAISAAKTHGLELDRIHCINALYSYWQTRGLYEIAEDYLNQAFDSASRMNDPVLLSETLQNVGRIAVARSDFDAAEKSYSDALAFARRINDKQRICACQQSLGVLAARRGELKKAENILLDALQSAHELSDDYRACGVLLNLGGILIEQGKLKGAQHYYEEALELSADQKHDRRYGLILYNLGSVMSKLGNHVRADAYYREALENAEKIGDLERICALLGNLGVEAYLKRNLKSSEALIDRGLDIARKINHNLLISRHLTNRATLFMKKGKHQDAVPILLEAMAIVKPLRVKWDILVLHNRLGECYLEQGDYQEAEINFQYVFGIAEKEGNQEQLARAYFGMAQLESKQGKIDSSIGLANKSLEIFEAMSHRKMEEVRAWLLEYTDEKS